MLFWLISLFYINIYRYINYYYHSLGITFQIHLSKYGMPLLLISLLWSFTLLSTFIKFGLTRGKISDMNKKVKNADILGCVFFPSIDFV